MDVCKFMARLLYRVLGQSRLHNEILSFQKRQQGSNVLQRFNILSTWYVLDVKKAQKVNSGSRPRGSHRSTYYNNKYHMCKYQDLWGYKGSEKGLLRADVMWSAGYTILY